MQKKRKKPAQNRKGRHSRIIFITQLTPYANLITVFYANFKYLNIHTHLNYFRLLRICTVVWTKFHFTLNQTSYVTDSSLITLIKIQHMVSNWFDYYTFYYAFKMVPCVWNGIRKSEFCFWKIENNYEILTIYQWLNQISSVFGVNSAQKTGHHLIHKGTSN